MNVIDLQKLTVEDAMELKDKNKGYYIISNYLVVPVNITKIELTIVEKEEVRFTLKEIFTDKTYQITTSEMPYGNILIYRKREDASLKLIEVLQEYRLRERSPKRFIDEALKEFKKIYPEAFI